MDRFQRLTLRLSHIQKTIQRIKTLEMDKLGLKGSHAQCISCLIAHPEGLTAGQISAQAGIDKAAVSRTLRDLEAMHYICYADSKKYRGTLTLTEKGRTMAVFVGQEIQRCVSAGREAISDDELFRFYETLGKLTRNLDALCETLESAGEVKL